MLVTAKNIKIGMVLKDGSKVADKKASAQTDQMVIIWATGMRVTYPLNHKFDVRT